MNSDSRSPQKKRKLSYEQKLSRNPLQPGECIKPLMNSSSPQPVTTELLPPSKTDDDGATQGRQAPAAEATARPGPVEPTFATVAAAVETMSHVLDPASGAHGSDMDGVTAAAKRPSSPDKSAQKATNSHNAHNPEPALPDRGRDLDAAPTGSETEQPPSPPRASAVEAGRPTRSLEEELGGTFQKTQVERPRSPGGDSSSSDEELGPLLAGGLAHRYGLPASVVRFGSGPAASNADEGAGPSTGGQGQMPTPAFQTTSQQGRVAQDKRLAGVGVGGGGSTGWRKGGLPLPAPTNPSPPLQDEAQPMAVPMEGRPLPKRAVSWERKPLQKDPKRELRLADRPGQEVRFYVGDPDAEVPYLLNSLTP